MTIGIAAAGPGAAGAILDALARVEAVAEGAIGGFVSMAVMTDDGTVQRAEIQRGGARALLARPPPATLLDAPLAVLMSSGPDRPAPLSQFTPARAGVGLVTGRRFPNALGVGGRPLALEALDLMADGCAPTDAAHRVAERNPQADAGLVLLSMDGRIGMANTRLVRRHADLGQAVARWKDRAVAVMHNSIAPHDVLAPLTVELVERRLGQGHSAKAVLQIAAGLPVRPASARSCVEVAAGRATALDIATVYNGDPSWSAGLGPDAEIFEEGRLIGHAAADPFLVIHDGRLVTVDGQAATALTYRPVSADTVLR